MPLGRILEREAGPVKNHYPADGINEQEKREEEGPMMTLMKMNCLLDATYR